MKSILYLITLTLSLATYSQTQTFYASYNTFSGGASDIKKTYDNKLLIFTRDYSSNIHHLVKIDTMGYILWQTKLTSPYSQNSFHVAQTTDSGFVALLCSYSGGGIITIVKIDKNGNYLWSKKYNQSSSNQGKDITATENGGFAIIGGGCSGNNFIIKFDVNGNIIWKNQYRDFSHAGSFGANIIHNKDRSIVVSGATNNNYYNYQAILFSVDSLGNNLWYKIFSLPRQTIPQGIIKALDHGYTLTGYTNAVDTNISCPFLLHTDSLGNFLWAKYYNHNLNAYPADILQLADSSYIISGVISYTTSANNQMLNIKTDKNGNFVWGQSSGNIAYNGNGADELTSSEWINGTTFYTAGAADNTIVTKNIALSSGNCTNAIVNYSVVSLNANVVIPTINIIPLAFASDTTLITTGNPGYARNVLCSTTAIKDIEFINKLDIFPNPFFSYVTIVANSQFKNATLGVYNSLGIQVKQIKNISSNTITLPRDNLPSGLYFLQISQEGKTISTDKLIISDN